MLPIDSGVKVPQVQDNYLDPNSLNSIKAMGRDRDPQAIKEVAKKFEGLLVQQMLKSMREANDVFSEGNFLDSQTTRFHRDMLDQQMVLDLTSGPGIGLADHFYRQMMQNYGGAMRPDADVPLNAVAPLQELTRRNTARPVAQTTAAIAAPVGQKTSISLTQENFVMLLKPHAEKAAAQLQISPDVLIAQVALETGWGKHVIHDRAGNNSFNLFNIKAGGQWQGEKVNVNTLEYRNGIAAQEKSDFRKYNDYSDSFSDYVRLMKNNPRYEKVLAAGTDSPAYAEALQSAGYATDPDYAKKIKQLLNSDAIQSLDIPIAENIHASAPAVLTLPAINSRQLVE